MNHLTSDTTEMLKALVPQVKDNKDVEVIVAPTYVSIAAAKAVVSGTNVKLAAQNCYFETSCLTITPTETIT